jgi:hypothetical protein
MTEIAAYTEPVKDAPLHYLCLLRLFNFFAAFVFCHTYSLAFNTNYLTREQVLMM